MTALSRKEEEVAPARHRRARPRHKYLRFLMTDFTSIPMDVNIFKSYDNIFNFFLAVNEGIFHMWTFSFNNDNNQGFHMQIQPWDIHMSSTTGLKRQKQLGNHLLTKGRPPTQPGNGRWVTFLSKNVCWSHNKYPLGGLSSRKGLRIPKSFKKKKKKLWKKDEV